MEEAAQDGFLGWAGIARLGLVQAALGTIVVLMTATLNRVMVVEMGLAALVPGLLVGTYHGMQIARPLWGHGADIGGRRTAWIIGGMALLALAGAAAAGATGLMAQRFAAGFALAFVSFAAIGVGAGAAGTALLALLAATVAPARRPAAAMLAWLMMIAAIALTAFVTGWLLDPFSFSRLVAIAAATGAAALGLTVAALWRLEKRAASLAPEQERTSFREGLAAARADPATRRFTVFVLVSMLAYSMQDLILEPYAGLLFGMSPGETTRLSGLQNVGVLVGMVLAGAAGGLARRRGRVVSALTVGGCLLSAAALGGLGLSAAASPAWPLRLNVLALGLGNGVFTVGAIASMMALAGRSGSRRAGLRMGIWTAAQGLAFGFGGLLGTGLVGLLRLDGLRTGTSYGAVFLAEAALFVLAALFASRIALGEPEARAARPPVPQPAE